MSRLAEHRASDAAVPSPLRIAPPAGPVLRRDLSPASAIGRLDRAFVLVRAGGLGLAARAWAAGAPVATALLALYYFERVEGVRTLRAMFAPMLVLAWWWRALALGRVARAHVRALWAGAPVAAGAGGALATLRTATWTAVGLWCWAWLVVLGAFGGLPGVLGVVPFFALRGAVAPSWIARAACTEEAGLRAIRGAIADSTGQRADGMFAELLLLLGALGLYFDLLAAIALLLLLGRSFLGLELALLDAFLSWRNTFAMLVVGMVTLVAIEPLRAALSAITWVEARVRKEGLDLRLAIEEAIRAASASRAQRAGTAVAWAMAALLPAATARAQVPPPAFPPPPPPATSVAPADVAAALANEPANAASTTPSLEDARAIAEAEEILARPEFREFADTRGQGLRELFERLLEWLFRRLREVDARPAPSLPAVALPGPIAFLVIAVAVLAAFVALALMTRPQRRMRRGPDAHGPNASTPEDPRQRPPEAWVDEAAALAARGSHRQALRALYLATLVALDRRRLIRFDPTHTNGQYLRQMPDVDERQAFREFTRVFDHTWYGREDATEHDYRRCRALANRIVGASGGPA